MCNGVSAEDPLAIGREKNMLNGVFVEYSAAAAELVGERENSVAGDRRVLCVF